MTQKRREITEKEWHAYDWIEVGAGEYIRGAKYTDPPNDGFRYVDVTQFGDKEQRWERAVEIVKDE